MIRTLTTTTLAGLLLLAGPLAAEEEGDTGAELLSHIDATSGRNAARPNDETIARLVGRELSYGMSTRLRGVFVSSDGGTVTLRGTVTDADAREEAVSRASRIDGVHRIINRLATPDSPAPDTETPVDDVPPLAASTGVFEATPVSFLLSGNRAGRDVLVDIDDGAVTLRGEVNNRAAHHAAVAAAWRIPGARAVFDRLHVRDNSGVNDDNLERLVRFSLANSRAIQPYVDQAVRPSIERERKDLVEIGVEDGIVHLDGAVRTDGERALIEEVAAAVTGVFAVDSRLLVEPDLVIDGDRRASDRSRLVTELWNYGAAPILRRSRR